MPITSVPKYPVVDPDPALPRTVANFNFRDWLKTLFPELASFRDADSDDDDDRDSFGSSRSRYEEATRGGVPPARRGVPEQAGPAGYGCDERPQPGVAGAGAGDAAGAGRLRPGAFRGEWSRAHGPNPGRDAADVGVQEPRCGEGAGRARYGGSPARSDRRSLECSREHPVPSPRVLGGR